MCCLPRLPGRGQCWPHVPPPRRRCIPGIIHYKDCKIQLLDLPGIIEGASEGKGRGRQVIGVARSVDLVLMVVDAGSGKAERQRELLERELEIVGLRLNQRPPNVTTRRRRMAESR